MTQEQTREEVTRHHRDIAVLLASASALTGSPSLIDRMTYTLSPEPAVKAVSDALRIIESDQVSSNPKLKTGRNEKGDNIVTVEGLTIYGKLPSGEDVRRFIEVVEKDVTIARKIGTIASGLLVEAMLKKRGE